MNKTIKDLSVTELKAACFDSLVTIEQQQMNIKLINEELARRANENKPAEVKAD